ncbi:MAG: hypothetical protein GY750_02895 [Lentisphaerae bacterium]|nr:hypothetical protein [Lentisphaerota bacterium]
MKTLSVCLTCLLAAGCTGEYDLAPLVGHENDVEKVYYPSSDYKPAAVVVDKNGDVTYYRLNGFGKLKDKKRLFNIKEFKSAH